MLAEDPFVRDTPAELLDAAGPELRPLVAGRAMERVVAKARGLSLPAQVVCLECRLAEHDDRVDLALCLAPHAARLLPALEALARAHASNDLWRRCSELLLRWASRSEPALSAVPFLFAAFDLDGEAPALPAPCLTLCTDPGFFIRQAGLFAPARAPHTWPLELLDACWVSLGLGSPTLELCKRFEACSSAVFGTEVRHLSLMLGRDPMVHKLDVTVPAPELGRFLRVNGWQGNVAAVSDQLRFVAPSSRRFQINYVIEPSGASSGLEVEFCSTGSDESGVAARLALLARLGAMGLVSPAKAGALGRLSSGGWLARVGAHRIACNWYVKLRFEGDRPTAAKAYLGLIQRRSGESAGLEALKADVS